MDADESPFLHCSLLDLEGSPAGVFYVHLDKVQAHICVGGYWFYLTLPGWIKR